MSGKIPDTATKVQHFLFPQRPFSQNISESEDNLESIKMHVASLGSFLPTSVYEFHKVTVIPRRMASLTTTE